MSALLEHGHLVLHEPSWARDVAERPWDVAHAIAARLGAEVLTVERQPIRAVEGGRSFASSDGPAPLHTDSQLLHGRPPHLQVLCCLRAAQRGGESLIADGRALCADIAARDAALHDALYRSPRSFPFVFGDFVATTIAAVDDDVFFTHSPRGNDPIGVAVEQHLARVPRARIALRPGDALLVDNHRMLHGRTAFDDRTRELQRLLVWLRAPLGRDDRLERARRQGRAPRRAGVDPSIAGVRQDLRRSLVSELRRGVPPGVLARVHGLPEAWLYVFRDEDAR